MKRAPQSNSRPNTFKVVIVGDQSVGKTHILHQYIHGHIPQNIQATIGVDFMTKLITLEQTNEVVKLSFFDTAGEEKFHAVTACHYRKAKGAIIVYDVTNRQSFENVAGWLNDVRQLTDSDCTIMILGNKKDIDMQDEDDQYNNQHERQVSTEEGIQFAKENEVSFFEVSALKNMNIDKAFQVLGSQILERFRADQLNRSSRRNSHVVKIEKNRFECCISRSANEGNEKSGMGCC